MNGIGGNGNNSMMNSGRMKRSNASATNILAKHGLSTQKDRDVNGMCRGRPKGVAVALNSRLKNTGRFQESTKPVNGHHVVNIHSLPGVTVSHGRHQTCSRPAV